MKLPFVNGYFNETSIKLKIILNVTESFPSYVVFCIHLELFGHKTKTCPALSFSLNHSANSNREDRHFLLKNINSKFELVEKA